MNLLKSILVWLGRQLTLLLIIAAALGFYRFALPPLIDFFANEDGQAWLSSDQLLDEIEAERADAIEELSQQTASLETLSVQQREALLDDRRKELIAATGELDEQGWFDTVRPSAILSREGLKLKIRRIEGEITILERLAPLGDQQTRLNQLAYPSAGSLSRAKKQCDDANRQAREFNEKTISEQVLRNIVSDEARTLTEEAADNCANFRQVAKLRSEGLSQATAIRNTMNDIREAAAMARTEAAAGLENFRSEPVTTTIADIFRTALVLLAALIAMPFLIRTIFYFVLAPLAQRRAHVRITVPGATAGGGTNNPEPIPLAALSRVSLPVTLGGGEELMVRQDYLQTSSVLGDKSTRWLLDYSHPFSSIASRMSFLTRIRGEGEVTTVSAVKDAFAELTELTLPEGSSCVLHPRALVGVVQLQEEPLLITSHWRLFSLNAWLTLQLRYMVFHGYCRLIVKGGRGIRVERAEQGRIFGQDQLVGFSSDLAYSVIRTETFGPYLFGRETLLKDKIEHGDGILIIEEAPVSAKDGNGARGGLEGAFDAGLKAFGL